MIDQNLIYETIVSLLDKRGVEHKLFDHKEALTWQELEEVQKEVWFFWSELKCMVLKIDDKLIVYITLQGKKVNFDVMKEKFDAKKVRLSTPEELLENFWAKPGCAYPFGFDSQHDIFIDPVIYEQEWVLFSPILPTKTVQAKGWDMKKVFDKLENKIEVVSNFNQI